MTQDASDVVAWYVVQLRYMIILQQILYMDHVHDCTSADCRMGTSTHWMNNLKCGRTSLWKVCQVIR